MPGLELSWINGLAAGIVAIILGVIVIAFPKILNYIIGAIMVLFGILWLLDHQWWLGGGSLAFGILVFIFPAILNYLVAAWLAMWGLVLIFASTFVPGIIMMVCAVIVLVFPAILNYIFGLYLIVMGFLAISTHCGWFGGRDFFALLPLIGVRRNEESTRFIKPVSLP